MIRVICSKCRTPANLPDSAAGKVAVCKCGQKNPIPKPGAPVAGAQPAVQQRAQPAAKPAAAPSPAAPQAPQPAPVVIDTPAPVGLGDDLALQDLDHDTGANKETAPVPCPACEKPLPPGEIVCHFCGYVAQEGLMGKSKRIVEKPKTVSWGGKKPSELQAMDFVKIAIAEQVFSTMMRSILRAAFACLLVVGIGIGVFFLTGLIQQYFPQGRTPVSIAAVVLLVAMFFGTITKEPFAICQAACFGYDHPKVNDWPTFKTGFLFLLIAWLPGLLGFLTHVGGGPIAGVIVFWLVALFVVPMALLSVAQSGGEWSSLNPVRTFVWLGKIIAPYLGIAALIFAEFTILIGLGVFGATLIGLGLLDAQGAIDWGTLGMLAGLFVVVTVLLLHPFVYGAAMLGMLYRKYERKLMK